MKFMGKNKHTPGPWTINDGVIEAPDGWVAMTHISRNPDDPTLRRKEETDANTRLIAAAPELLEACKAMLETEITGTGHDEAMDKIQRAIVKAEKRH